MKKGQRPQTHLRNVRTRNGGRLTLINPEVKKITNKQYRKAMKKLSPLSDADNDGVRNIDDCKPFDKNKQDEYTSGDLGVSQKEAEELLMEGVMRKTKNKKDFFDE